MLRIINLNKSFPQRGKVLNNLDLKINKGDSVAIMGPSGSGKTTLLNIIGLLDNPDSGEILFSGNSILKYNQMESAAYRNRNLGFVFQEHHLLPFLTIKENIVLPLVASKLSDREYQEKVNAADVLMESIEIHDISNKYPFQVSGGEAQRAAVVRALINKPSLLLADEPTGSLDNRNADNLGDILLKLNIEMGVTMLIATHSERLAGRMAIKLKLSDGTLKPEEIR